MFRARSAANESRNKGPWGTTVTRLPRVGAAREILRRSYAYTDGVDPRTGLLDAGLFFVCFQRDPHRQFAAIQRRLGASDALNEYIQHTSSALFAIPPGASASGFVGEGLFA